MIFERLRNDDAFQPTDYGWFHNLSTGPGMLVAKSFIRSGFGTPVREVRINTYIYVLRGRLQAETWLAGPHGAVLQYNEPVVRLDTGEGVKIPAGSAFRLAGICDVDFLVITANNDDPWRVIPVNEDARMSGVPTPTGGPSEQGPQAKKEGA